MKDGLKLRGAMEMVLERRDESGKLLAIETRRKDNLIVDVGFDFVADSIGKATGRPNVMSHIAVGTGTTAAAGSQTALVTEIMRKAAAYAHVVGSKTFTFEVTFEAGEATGALTEAGVFNAATAGTMLDRVVFGVINKGANDTLKVTFTFTMS